MREIRIVLADDHVLVMAGIRALLKEIPGVVIVAEVNNGRDAVAIAKATRPDLVVMDISMAELNGIDATLEIRAALAATRVLILSMHKTADFVRRALAAGACAYLVKDSAPLELATAVAAVMRGEQYISSHLSAHHARAL